MCGKAWTCLFDRDFSGLQGRKVFGLTISGLRNEGGFLAVIAANPFDVLDEPPELLPDDEGVVFPLR